MKTKKTEQAENSANAVLGEALGRLIPATIDEVITKHRDRAELRISTADDLARLLASVPYDSTAQHVSGWTLVTLDFRPPSAPRQVVTVLLGHHVQKNQGWHTSLVRKLDQATGCCQTHSGTLYHMSGPSSDKPDVLRLCAWLYTTGLGDYLGAMRIFY